MSVILHGMRFHEPFWTECNDLEDACLTALAWVPSHPAAIGWAAPTHITDDAGNVLMDEGALKDWLYERV